MEDLKDLQNAIKDHRKVIAEHQQIINHHSEIITNLKNELRSKKNKMTMEKFQSCQKDWFEYFTLWNNNFENVSVTIDTQKLKRQIAIRFTYKNNYFPKQYYKIIVLGTRKLNYSATNLTNFDDTIDYETLPDDVKKFVAAVVKNPVRAEEVFRMRDTSESEEESEDEEEENL